MTHQHDSSGNKKSGFHIPHRDVIRKQFMKVEIPHDYQKSPQSPSKKGRTQQGFASRLSRLFRLEDVERVRFYRKVPVQKMLSLPIKKSEELISKLPKSPLYQKGSSERCLSGGGMDESILSQELQEILQRSQENPIARLFSSSEKESEDSHPPLERRTDTFLSSPSEGENSNSRLQTPIRIRKFIDISDTSEEKKPQPIPIEKVSDVSQQEKTQTIRLQKRETPARVVPLIKKETVKPETRISPKKDPSEALSLPREKRVSPQNRLLEGEDGHPRLQRSHPTSFPAVRSQGKVSAPKRRRVPRKKRSLVSEIKALVITIAVIFLGLYGLGNAPALSELFIAKINPEKAIEKQVALEKVVETKEYAPILPTAGMQRENKKQFPSLSMGVTPLDNRIVIPKIGRNIPVVDVPIDALEDANWKKLEADIQDGLRDGVVHYPGTAEPGQVGNVFITGHSSYYLWDPGKYKDVFARLHDLYEGDEFTVFYNQKVYHYRVRERKVVSPENTEVLAQPKDESIATLMTCTPIGTTINRLILVAEDITDEKR